MLHAGVLLPSHAACEADFFSLNQKLQAVLFLPNVSISPVSDKISARRRSDRSSWIEYRLTAVIRDAHRSLSISLLIFNNRKMPRLVHDAGHPNFVVVVAFNMTQGEQDSATLTTILSVKSYNVSASDIGIG